MGDVAAARNTPLPHVLPCQTWSFSIKEEEEKKKISHRQLGRCMGAHPLLALWRGLNPVRPACDPDQPDGQLNLTASAFNQLGQYTSSPCRMGYCYAELAIFFPSSGRNHRQYSLCLLMEGWPG